MFVNNSAFMDINQTKEEFRLALEGLMKRKLVSLVEVDVDRFELDKSMKLLCFASDLAVSPSTAGNFQMMVLRPFYQPPVAADRKVKGK